MRLGQRIIHIITTQMISGDLYEVDMRLRPSGNSGMLVASLASFEKYQRKDAWTWEHQALVRARPVAGDTGLAERFNLLRREVLGRERDPEVLRDEVAQMREKMRANLEQREAGMLDLKQGRGGIADIEFITQYLVLRYTCKHPEIATFTDNIRILEAMGESGLWPIDEVQSISDAYRSMRRQIHLQALQSSSAMASTSQFKGEIRLVQALWDKYLCTTSAGK